MRERSIPDLNRSYGPWALVTGATSGIGGAIADRLADAGLNLLIVARNHTRLEEKSTLLQKTGVKVIPVAGDLATADGIGVVLQRTASMDVGLFVSSAGAVVTGDFFKNNVDQYVEELVCHTLAPMMMLHEVGKRRVSRRERFGAILVSSLAAAAPAPLIANYAASKAYLSSLGLAVGSELARSNVDLLVLEPGLTRTDLVARSFPNAKKLPMADPGYVAMYAVEQLHRRGVVVPGLRNRSAAFVARRVLDRRRAAALGARHIGAMLSRADERR